MTYNAPNYFEQGSQKLVLNGDVEYGTNYNPSGNGANVAAVGALTAITDPTDTPASADALRDDLVANALPEIAAHLDTLQAKIDELIGSLETAKVLADS